MAHRGANSTFEDTADVVARCNVRNVGRQLLGFQFTKLNVHIERPRVSILRSYMELVLTVSHYFVAALRVSFHQLQDLVQSVSFHHRMTYEQLQRYISLHGHWQSHVSSTMT